MDDENTFTRGTAVRFKGQNTVMKVLQKRESPHSAGDWEIECMWFNGSNIERARYSAQDLEAVPDEVATKQTASATEIAGCMKFEMERAGRLYQEAIAPKLNFLFGSEATYFNKNGNLAISKAVLDAFTRLTGDAVVWEHAERCWRPRRPGDRPGRQQ